MISAMFDDSRDQRYRIAQGMLNFQPIDLPSLVESDLLPDPGEVFLGILELNRFYKLQSGLYFSDLSSDLTIQVFVG